jgi:hypothetical protein
VGVTGKTVFVLGAGFTRAFLPRAPLLTDDYGAADLVRRLQGYPNARRILLQELARNGDGRLNIERLLTRLDGGMPYDADCDATAEVGLLAAELMQALVRRIESAKSGTVHREELLSFAQRCLRDGITCVTFNYDDILDGALYDAGRVPNATAESGWHPDTGYGFVCPSSATCVHAGAVRTTPSPLLLLKLHGSLNWRLKLGAQPSGVVDALVHHEDWSVDPSREGGAVRERIERHLAPGRFIAAPLLAKTAVAERPVLGRLWALAYQALGQAERVIFLGYSLPPADVAAAFLFREACGDLRPAQLQVVNLASSEELRREVRAAYRQVFPDLPDAQFVFQDARDWARAWSGHAGVGLS